MPASADGEGHVEVGLPGGLRLLFDTEDVIRSFHPNWTPMRGGRTRPRVRPARRRRAWTRCTPTWWRPGTRASWRRSTAFWGQRYAVVLDPDGNGVDLFAPLAS